MKFAYWVAAFAVSLAACSHGGGSSAPPTPQVAHLSQGFGGEILDVTIQNPSSGDLDVEFDLGLGYRVRTSPIFEGWTLLRVPLPLGKMDSSAGLTTGTISMRVVRTKDGKSSYSSWKSITVGQFDGGSHYPGEVAFYASKASHDLVVHGVGDTWLIDSNAFGQLDFNPVLETAWLEYDGFEILRSLVERAGNGQVVSIGETFAGDPIVLTQASLPILDRLLATLHGTIAFEFGALPPDPQSISSFYIANAHDPNPANIGDSIRTAFGTTRSSLELYRLALHANGGSVAKLDASTLGAFAWFSAFTSGFASAMSLDALPAQAGANEGAFELVGSAVEEGISHAEDFVLEHFSPFLYEFAYGPELMYAGGNFLEGFLAKEALRANIEVGFASGFISPDGLPPPAYTISSAVNLFSSHYTVTIVTNPATPGQTIGIRIVGDGVIGGEEVVTDAFGVAVSNPIPNGDPQSFDFDIVHALNLSGGGPESQDGSVVIFP